MQGHVRRAISCIATAVALSISSTALLAAPVTVTFETSQVQVFGGSQELRSQLAGAIFVGSFIYESSTPLSLMRSDSAVYFGAIASGSFSIAGRNLITANSGGEVVVGDGPSDFFQASGDQVLGARPFLPFGPPIPGGASPISWRFSLFSGTPFPDTSLPSFVASDAFSAGSFQLRFSDLATVEGAITSYAFTSPIPEPETYAMLLAGLALLGLAMGRRNASLGSRTTV